MKIVHQLAFTTLLGASLLAGLPTGAQAQNTACLGEQVTVQLDSIRGSVQWQKSTNGTTFTNLVGQTGISIQENIVADAWYRAYQLTEEGCDTVWSDVFNIALSTLALDAGQDQTICEFTSTGLVGTAIGGAAPYTYLWSPSTGLSDPNIGNPTATPAVTTTYHLTLTDSKGCVKEDSVVVVVNPVTSGSQTFAGTGSTQTFTVPPCITQVRVELYGAQGNPGVGTSAGQGGFGGYVDGMLAVSPGDVIHINVGTQAGFNGGGAGGTSLTRAGGGGGGASDVRLNGTGTANLAAIAGGGGGGGGGGGFVNGTGGTGGNNNGAAGNNGANATTSGITSGLGGTGATPFAGGTGGTGGTGCTFYVGLTGAAGAAYAGGAGGNGTVTGGSCTLQGGGGGGGGGGIFGGAGGGAGAPGSSSTTGGGGGGGAGSSSSGVLTGATVTNSTQVGNGQVIITW